MNDDAGLRGCAVAGWNRGERGEARVFLPSKTFLVSRLLFRDPGAGEGTMHAAEKPPALRFSPTGRTASIDGHIPKHIQSPHFEEREA